MLFRSGATIRVSDGEEAVAFEVRENEANSRLLYFSNIVRAVSTLAREKKICDRLVVRLILNFQQNGNLFLSQEINKIALTTHSFSSKSSHGLKPISSQVTPYGAPPEVFVFGLCQLYNETGRPGFLDLLILFMDFSFTNTKYD